ncbi:MAG: ECF transporter S component [Candidatus Aenigmarchaeota archaeon]|nr:ECF transporter S component [Candidatus Aenigmarchaeota archaeon]
MEQELKQKSQQGTLLLSAQRTKYSLKRKLLLMMGLTSLGILGRAAFQFIPSVEPLTPLAILTGFLLGPISGFISGVVGFYLSNFLVWGFQGPWTIFQCLGAGLAGFIGGLIGKLGKKSRTKFLISTFIGIIVYEIIVTVSMGIMFAFPLLLFYIITSIPFSLIHLSSSLGFSFSFYEFKDQIKKLKGGLIEKEILGFRFVNSGTGKPANKLVPYLYVRKIHRNDKGKSKDRFWYFRKDKNS